MLDRRTDIPPYPGEEPPRPSDKALAKAKKRIEKRGKRARKKGLDVLLEAIKKDPSTVEFGLKGVWNCLFDSHDIIATKACSFVIIGAKRCPGLFLPLAEPLAMSVTDSSPTSFAFFRKALITLARTSNKAAETVMKRLAEHGPTEVSWDDELFYDCQRLIRINSVLSKLGSEVKRCSNPCISLMARSLRYPVYRPERTNETVEKVYKKSIRGIVSVCKTSPRSTRQVVPMVLKVLGDTLIFDKWKGERDEPDSMYSVFDGSFKTLTLIGGKYTVVPMVKGLSSTNSKVAGIVRERFRELARKPEKVVPALLNCSRHNSSRVRKDARKMLVDISVGAPDKSAKIILNHIRGTESPRIKTTAIGLVGDLVERTDVDIGKRIGYVLRSCKDADSELSKKILNTLGKVALDDKKLLGVITKFLIKGLAHRDYAVRLTALSTLGKLLERYGEIRSIVVPPLMSCARDSEETVRWRSTNMLKKLGFGAGDMKDFHAATGGIAKTRELMKELRKGGNVDLRDIEKKLKRAYVMTRKRDYKKAAEYANSARDAVLEVRPEKPPELSVDVVTENDLFAKRQNRFRLEIENVGSLHAYDLSLSFPDNVEVIGSVPKDIMTGEIGSLEVGWTPSEDGRRSFELKLSFEDFAKFRTSMSKKIWLNVEPYRKPDGETEPDPHSDMYLKKGSERKGARDVAVEIEDIYLIHRKTGTLIERRTWRSEDLIDPDVMSGMFRAILDFVDQSFVAGERSSFSRIYVKGYIILIYDGEIVSIALVFSGNAEKVLYLFGEEVKAAINETVTIIEKNNEGRFEDFDGETAALRGCRKNIDELSAKLNDIILRTSPGEKVEARIRKSETVEKAVKDEIESEEELRTEGDGEDELPEIEILSTEKSVKKEKEETIYTDALYSALKDNVITHNEEQMLETLRERFGVSIERHRELVKKIQSEKYREGELEKEIKRKLTTDDLSDVIVEDGRGGIEKATIRFRPGRTRIGVRSTKVLERVFDQLIMDPELEVEISGHTDDRFATVTDQRKRKAENEHLSFERAKTVRGFLVSRGIASDRMTVKGYGGERPIADNDTPEGQRLNQRAEIRLYHI